jgi:hypothetical protein
MLFLDEKYGGWFNSQLIYAEKKSRVGSAGFFNIENQ